MRPRDLSAWRFSRRSVDRSWHFAKFKAPAFSQGLDLLCCLCAVLCTLDPPTFETVVYGLLSRVLVALAAYQKGTLTLVSFYTNSAARLLDGLARQFYILLSAGPLYTALLIHFLSSR